MKERFVRAVPATFGVHVAQTSIAVLAASIWSAGFVAAFGGHPDGVEALRHGGPIAVESIGSFLESHAGWGFGYTGAVALSWWLASIPVQMVWLHAHQHTLDRRSVREALRRSIPALGASLLMLLPFLLVILAGVGLPWAWIALHDSVDSRMGDLGLLVALAPGLVLWLVWSAWFDTSRAAIALGLGPLEAIRAAWRVRTTHLYAVWWLVGLALSLAAVGMGGPGWWILVGAQLALLARTYARSAWWSCALSRISASRERNHGHNP